MNVTALTAPGSVSCDANVTPTIFPPDSNGAPGITGLAQVTGRNALAWHDRIPYDIYYHYRRSLAMDLRIIGRTLAMLLKLDIERPLVSPAELKAFMSSAGLSEAAEQLRQEVLLHPRSGSTTVSRP